MTEVELSRAAVVAGPIVILLVVGFFGISYIISTVLGFSISLNLPIVMRVVGGVLVVTGLAIAGWTFKYRSPSDMIVSTYVTFTKLFRRNPIAERLGRTEPLVIEGLQRYVRNPLYFGVIMMTFGWALVGGYIFVLVATVILLLWFRVVLIPFEEKELLALFGEQHARYKEDVPMLVPFTKWKKHEIRVVSREASNN
jgi:protein-S-isoprenylcysteine O-methyltransferase Ste14